MFFRFWSIFRSHGWEVSKLSWNLISFLFLVKLGPKPAGLSRDHGTGTLRDRYTPDALLCACGAHPGKNVKFHGGPRRP